jgi:hypothetical protein
MGRGRRGIGTWGRGWRGCDLTGWDGMSMRCEFLLLSPATPSRGSTIFLEEPLYSTDRVGRDSD